jgi:type 1 fimbriae regulatory protein FimB/type 1 fimbriae regulatory protein FimE
LACHTRRADLDLRSARIWVRCLKRSLSTEQPITGEVLRALRAYLRTREDRQRSLFVSERGGPLTRQAVFYLVRRLAARAACTRTHCATRAATRSPTKGTTSA